MTAEQCYAACMRTIQQTLEGAGAVRGVPCELESIEEHEDAFLMTYKWEERDGSVHRQEMLFPKPQDLTATYDYDELLIGSWVNGEPVYRKVFRITNTTAIQKGNTFTVCDIVDSFPLKMLIKGYGIIKTYEGSYSNNDILIYQTSNAVKARQNFTGYPQEMYIILEYTRINQNKNEVNSK